MIWMVSKAKFAYKSNTKKYFQIIILFWLYLSHFKVRFGWFKKAGLFSEYLTSKLASHQLVWSSQPQPTLFEAKISELEFFNFLDIKRLILALKQHNLPLFKVLLYKHYLSGWSLAIAGRLTPAQLQLVVICERL